MAYNQILPDDTGREHIIEIKDLCKSFDGTQVLKDITFYIRNNEFITLLGPSAAVSQRRSASSQASRPLIRA